MNYYASRTITKRETLFSIIIIFVMLTSGYFISEAVSNYVVEKNEVFYKAIKIDDKEQFEYGMKTNIGNALVYGEVKTVNPVTMPELSKKYFEINKITERYTRHTKQVRHKTSSGHVYYTTKVYYTWDYRSSDNKTASSITFLDVKFSSSKIDFHNIQRLDLNDKTVSSQYVDSIKYNYIYDNTGLWNNVGDLRHYFNVIPVEFKGSILTKLHNSSITNIDNEKAKIDFIHDKNTNEVIDDIQKSEDMPVTIFWVVWILLTIGVTVGFVLIDNRWLEDRRR